MDNCTEPLTPAQQASARLLIHRFPKVEFSMQAFTLPGANVILPKVNGPVGAIYMGHTRVEYPPLTARFLVDEELRNYEEILKWMQQTMTEPQESITSDGTIVLLSSRRNPIRNIKVTELMPESLSPLEYVNNGTEPVYLQASVVFKYTKYEFE